MATYRLWIAGWRPPSLNRCRGRHWSVEARLKRQTAELLGVHARLNGIPDATGPRRLCVRIVLAPRQREYDDDNPWKVLLDSLKTAHLILDDRRGMVEWSPPTYERGTSEFHGTYLTLEDLA